MVVLIIISMFIALMYLAIGLGIQAMSSNAVFFGVRIPLGYEKREDLKKEKKKYSKLWFILWLISSIILIGSQFILPEEYLPINFMILTFGQLILMQLCFYRTFKRVKEIKKRENWKELLTPKNVVYTDLKFRSQVDKGISKKLIIIPWIMFVINVLISFINVKEADFLLVGAHFVLLLMMQFSFKSVIEGKVNFNGGEVESLKKSSLNTRIFSGKILWISTIFISILFVAINLVSMSVISENMCGFIIIGAILGDILISVSIIIMTMFIRKREKELSENVSEEGKVIINRDDDENYLMGMIYYNPNDSALFVDKRVGIGTTVNMAHVGGKIIMGITALIIVACFAVCFYAPKSANAEVSKTETSIKMGGLYSDEIDFSNIEKVELMDKVPKIKLKKNGASIGKKHVGYYRLEGMSSAKLYLDDGTKKCIHITTKDGKEIFINYEDESKTENLYDEVKSSVK